MVWKLDAEKPVVVYGLCSSESGEVRYIGQTAQSLAKRLDSHIHPPKHARQRHCYKWIKSVMAKGHTVLIKIIYENAVWNETEQDLIRVFKEMGARLANHTDGGGGVRNRIWTPEQRKKLSDSRKGMVFSQEHRANLVRCRAGRIFPVDMGKKISASMKGKLPANILALHASVRGKPKSPEHRAKLSAAQTCIPHGEHRRTAKLTLENVQAIRASNLSRRELVSLFGIGKTQIGRILRGESWS